MTDSLLGFVDEFRRNFVADQPKTFWALEPALLRLITSGVIEACIRADLSALSSDEKFVGNWFPNEAVLHRDPEWTLSIALFDAPRRYVHALPFFAMYVPLSADLPFDVFRLPENFRNDVFDPTAQLERDGSGMALRRSIIKIDSDRYAYDFKFNEPVAIVRLITKPLRPLEWLFSKNTLQAWQANDADLSYTQLRVAAYVLGRIAHQSSISPLKDLSTHPHHAVRWAAIQNLGRLNRTEALAKIREAVNDQHPHVRRAAAKTLERLEAKVEK